MKIAIPTDDGVSFAGHTGRATGLAIFEVADGIAQQLEVRWRELPEGQQDHSHGHGVGEHSCSAENGHQGHSHGAILDLLADCDVLLAVGAGPRLVRDLAMQGVIVKFCRHASLAEAASLFAKGTLDLTDVSGCDHSGHHH